MILYLPVMEIDISKNLISQVLTIVVVILDDLIFTRAQKYLAIDWLALDGHTDEADAKKIEEYYRYDERKEKRLSVVLAVVTAAGAAAATVLAQAIIHEGAKNIAAGAVTFSVNSLMVSNVNMIVLLLNNLNSV